MILFHPSSCAASQRNAEGLKVRCGRNNRPHVLLREPYDDVAGQSLWALHAVLQSDARGTPAAAPWQRQEETVGVVIGTPVRVGGLRHGM